MVAFANSSTETSSHTLSTEDAKNELARILASRVGPVLEISSPLFDEDAEDLAAMEAARNEGPPREYAAFRREMGL